MRALQSPLYEVALRQAASDEIALAFSVILLIL
jgi:hypothetical protein